MSQVPLIRTLPSAQPLVARLDKGMVERNEFGFRIRGRAGLGGGGPARRYTPTRWLSPGN